MILEYYQYSDNIIHITNTRNNHTILVKGTLSKEEPVLDEKNYRYVLSLYKSAVFNSTNFDGNEPLRTAIINEMKSVIQKQSDENI